VVKDPGVPGRALFALWWADSMEAVKRALFTGAGAAERFNALGSNERRAWQVGFGSFCSFSCGVCVSGFCFCLISCFCFGSKSSPPSGLLGFVSPAPLEIVSSVLQGPLCTLSMNFVAELEKTIASMG
jgi:hypothetical protein